jgi:hypothetical protein
MLTATIACVPKPQAGRIVDCPGELLAFLKGVRTNNLLLVDADKKVIARLCETIRSSLEHIPPAYEKRLAILAESLRNLPTVVSLPFVTMDNSDQDGIACATLAYQATGDTGADAIVVIPPAHIEAACDVVPHLGTEVVDLRVYGASGLEHRRDSYCEQFSAAERDHQFVTDLFRRSLRFSKSLTLYDRNLGQYFEAEPATKTDAEKNTHGRERFEAALIFFLSQWRSTQHAEPNALVARVMTAVQTDRISNMPAAQQVQFRTMVRSFIRSVAAKSGVRVEILLKYRSWNVAHDRYLETDQAVIALPGGIDIICTQQNSSKGAAYQSNRNLQLVRGDDVRKELDLYTAAKTFLREMS